MSLYASNVYPLDFPMDISTFDAESQHTVNGRLNNNNLLSANGTDLNRKKSSSFSRKSAVSPSISVSSPGGGSGGGGGNMSSNSRRKKPCLSARERNVRRIESNERERLRMHGLNEAFQVGI